MNKLRLLSLFGALALVAIIISSLAASSIEITPSGGTAAVYSYQLVNQADNKLISVDNQSRQLNKRLSPGTYEVTVSQGNKSFFKLVTIKGLWGKTLVAANLQTEQQRTFVGDNPAACMNLLGTTLLSHDCGSTSGAVNTHVQPTSTQPAYIDTSPSPLGRIESTIKLKASALALFAKPTGEVEEDSPAAQHIVYAYDPAVAAFQPTDQATLTDLGRFISYSLQPYLAGFIAYDATYSHVLYYTSIHAKPINLTLEGPKTAGLTAFSLSAGANGEIAVAYAPDLSSGDGSGSSASATATEVVVYRSGGSNHYLFGSQYSVVQFCGGSNLCMLNTSANTLEVNGISGPQTTRVFNLRDVTHFIPSDQGFLAVRKNGLLKVDTNTKTGFIAYSFSKYQYCGLDTVVGGYIVCLTNPEGNNVALYLGQSAVDTDSIDKRVLELENNSNVVKLSIVGKIIYVVPKGDNLFNAATGTVAPNPAVQSGINQDITNAATKAGLDLKSYTLIITRPL